MQKKSNSQAQLHLPALDLFRANLRFQHYLPPLDLAWTLYRGNLVGLLKTTTFTPTQPPPETTELAISGRSSLERKEEEEEEEEEEELQHN